MSDSAYDSTKFTHKGYSFTMKLYRDDYMGEPWKEHDGHGVVSEWTSRDKAPSEIVLCSDRSSRRYYNWAESLKLALKDGWGPGEKRQVELETAIQGRFGRGPTKGEIAVEAVKADFKHLKDWCEDRWFWCGVAVTFEKDGFSVDGYAHAVWGIESESDGYLLEMAKEIADEVLGEYYDHMATVLE